MLEGQSDQILLAGMSAHLHRLGALKTENLNLNEVTLVPAGSASHIPYMVYLARGRDVERPAVIVLLDSDDAGDEVKRGLAKGGPQGKRLIDEKFVLQVGDLPKDDLKLDNPRGALVVEDLVPLAIGIAAAKSYVSEYLGASAAEAIAGLGVGDVNFAEPNNTHEAIEAAFTAALAEDFHLDKVGLARSITRVVQSGVAIGQPVDSDAVAATEKNFRRLFQALGLLQRAATRDYMTEKTSSRINRSRSSFLLDHPDRATREDADLLIEEIETTLDSSLDADELRLQLRRLRVDFDLDQDVAEDISDYGAFKDALVALVYALRRESQEPE
jgi:hypothetical protein